jgi:UTP-glucose-1-phosphate uridylyltransferase
VLRKAVIPAAGLGTRLLSVTKEQTKEMLPVFAKAKNRLSAGILKELFCVVGRKLF